MSRQDRGDIPLDEQMRRESAVDEFQASSEYMILGNKIIWPTPEQVRRRVQALQERRYESQQPEPKPIKSDYEACL